LLLKECHKYFKKTFKSDGGIVEQKNISISEASQLARVEKKFQKPLSDIIFSRDDLSRSEKNNLVTTFVNSDKKLKEEIIAGHIPLEKETPQIKNEVEMAIMWSKRSLSLINEMRTLRRAVTQFRKEKLFDSFPQKERTRFYDYFSRIKEEYTELINELDSALGVLK
jgi:hypothetical protein